MTPLDLTARADRAAWLADRAKRLQTALDHVHAIAADEDLFHPSSPAHPHLLGLCAALKENLRIVSDAAKALDAERDRPVPGHGSHFTETQLV